MKKKLVLYVCLAIPSFATAQQTLQVGPGQPFSDIPAAVSAAQAGDTVLVIGGTYDADFVVDKGIQLIGRGAVLHWNLFMSGVVVEDVPPGETFAFAGFSAAPASTVVAVKVRNCSGQVSLRELNLAGTSYWSVNVDDSAQVCVAEGVVHGCAFANSNVVCEHLVFQPQSLYGLSIVGGRTVVTACDVNGGWSVFGASGINLDGGELAITRSTVTATAPTAPAISTTGGVVVIDPSVSLVGGSGQAVSGNAAVISTEIYSLASSYQELSSVMRLENHGVTGQFFATVMSVPTAQTELPLGVAWVDPFAITVLDVASYGTMRVHNSSLALPPLPAGLTVALQSVVFRPSGLTLSTPSLLTIE